VSNLALSNKDDYPAAAAKHLADARALLAAQRFDGAAYLSGYVVECALRTVIMVGRLAKEAEQTALEQGRKTTKVDLKAELEPRSPTMKRFLKNAKEEARAQGRDHNLDDLAEATTGYNRVLESYVASYAPPVGKAKTRFDLGPKVTDIRYHAEGALTKDAASAWVGQAEAVYTSTIGAMIRDGLIRR
jgi:hypothetical protein